MAERYVRARLADLTHRVPLPGKNVMFTSSPEGEIVDTYDAFWKGLLHDGSLVLVPPEPAEDAPSAVSDGDAK